MREKSRKHFPDVPSMGESAYKARAKKSPYRKDTGVPDYFCHAVLMATNETDASGRGSPADGLPGPGCVATSLRIAKLMPARRGIVPG
jgi:hypothetical protein